MNSLCSRSIYNELIDFEILKSENLTWKHVKESLSFQEKLKSNRLESLDSQRNMPKLKHSRPEKLQLKEEKFARQMNLPFNTLEIYKVFYEFQMASTYPKLNILFEIYLAIAVSTITAERTFSALKRIKSWMRSTMGEERLSNLAILNIYRERAAIDIDTAIKVFANLNNRRCQY